MPRFIPAGPSSTGLPPTIHMSHHDLHLASGPARADRGGTTAPRSSRRIVGLHPDGDISQHLWDRYAGGSRGRHPGHQPAAHCDLALVLAVRDQEQRATLFKLLAPPLAAEVLEDWTGTAARPWNIAATNGCWPSCKRPETMMPSISSITSTDRAHRLLEAMPAERRQHLHNNGNFPMMPRAS